MRPFDISDPRVAEGFESAFKEAERGHAVRILKLEVENFRAIRAASIPFGPGLNVLHCPNDLGKSTLGRTLA